jgi:seryl-tRNA synthetase
MLDINLIREKPEFVKAAMVALNAEAPIDLILALDAGRRELLTEVEALRSERNTVSKEISHTQDREERQAKIERMRVVGDRIKDLEGELKTVESDLSSAMLQVPNLPGPDVPVGPDEAHNVVVWTKGEPHDFDFVPLAHWDLGPMGWEHGYSGRSSPGCWMCTWDRATPRSTRPPWSGER